MTPNPSGILVIGSGGREAAIVRCLERNYNYLLYCAPGNAGIQDNAFCYPRVAATDLDPLQRLANRTIALTVVGPEAPLAAGIVDRFRAAGKRIFGPTADAAQIESSKAFFAGFARRHDIPAPASEVYADPLEAKRCVTRLGAPIVVKASGLCAGKGVTVARTLDEAHAAIDRLMVRRELGDAGAMVVIQQCLVGYECSYTVITDGERFVPLATARDYKQLNDGDVGPMTGGMGGYSPEPRLTPALEQTVIKTIVIPTIRGMAAEGCPSCGVLYFALMLTDDGPKVLEVNCRLGDPETQVILARLKSDLLPVLLAAADGNLGDLQLEWSPHAAVCVAAVSDGYPGKYHTGVPIEGLPVIDSGETAEQYYLHAGTASGPHGEPVTSSGRVLYAVATGATFGVARGRAYQLLQRIRFDGMRYRGDIAQHLI